MCHIQGNATAASSTSLSPCWITWLGRCQAVRPLHVAHLQVVQSRCREPERRAMHCDMRRACDLPHHTHLLKLSIVRWTCSVLLSCARRFRGDQPSPEGPPILVRLNPGSGGQHQLDRGHAVSALLGIHYEQKTATDLPVQRPVQLQMHHDLDDPAPRCMMSVRGFIVRPAICRCLGPHA